MEQYGHGDIIQMENQDQKTIQTEQNHTQTNMKNVIDIAAGDKSYNGTKKKDGTVWETGYNNKGQLGDGTSTASNTFHKVKLNGDGDYLEEHSTNSIRRLHIHALTSRWKCIFMGI